MSNEKEILLEIIEKILDDVNNPEYTLLTCFKILLKDNYYSKIFIYQSGLYLSNNIEEQSEQSFYPCRFPDTVEKLYFNRIRDLKLKQLGI